MSASVTTYGDVPGQKDALAEAEFVLPHGPVKPSRFRRPRDRAAAAKLGWQRIRWRRERTEAIDRLVRDELGRAIPERHLWRSTYQRYWDAGCERDFFQVLYHRVCARWPAEGARL